MAGNQRISDLPENTNPDNQTWIETINLNENDPNLQNQKINFENVYDTEKHVQNTDQYLDFGGFNQISAVSLVSMQTVSHTKDFDTFLDKAGANEVTAANAADAVAKKHVQNTDTFLDQGGQNQVTAQNVATTVNTTQVFFWLESNDPTTNGFMDISLDNAGKRTVDFNNNNVYLVDMSPLLLSLAVGRYLVITFDGGHCIGAISSAPINNGTYVRININTMSADDNFVGIGQLTII
jgi:hypothetical protein